MQPETTLNTASHQPHPEVPVSCPMELRARFGTLQLASLPVLFGLRVILAGFR